METISARTVEKTWRRMSTMSPEGFPQIIDKLSSEQPAVLVYLLASGEDLFNLDERELLLYLGVVVWQIMAQGSTELREVTDETLDAVEDANLGMLEYLEDETEADFVETVEKIYTNYNQPEVLRYVVEALWEEEEEDAEIREEMKGMIFLFLKTVIDALDKSA